MGSEMLNWCSLNVLPKRTWPIWLLTIGMLASGPAVSLIYYPALLRSGTLPPHGDTIAIPIFQVFFGAAILAPIVLAITWLCLRHYNGGARLTEWRHDKPGRSAAVTLLFGAPALLLLGSGIDAYILRDLPLREYLWIGVTVPSILWLLTMRAVAISQISDKLSRGENS